MVRAKEPLAVGAAAEDFHPLDSRREGLRYEEVVDSHPLRASGAVIRRRGGGRGGGLRRGNGNDNDVRCYFCFCSGYARYRRVSMAPQLRRSCPSRLAGRFSSHSDGQGCTSALAFTPHPIPPPSAMQQTGTPYTTS